MKVYKKLFSYLKGEELNGYLSIFLSSISAIILVYAYFLIYKFFKELILSNNYEKASIYSIQLVIYLTLSGILYLLAGLFSHKLAFRLETKLRKRGIDGLSKASFRFFDLNASGYIRKSIDDNAVKTHMAVAHMLPDNAKAVIIPILTLILAFIVSFRVGILVIILSIFSILSFRAMTGDGKFMKFYQASLDKLSSETVEYIRGMQVIKIFRIKLKSFKVLHDAIIDYSSYAYNYSLSCKNPYVIYQLVFLGLIPIVSIPLSFFIYRINDLKTLALELIMLAFLSGVILASFMAIMWASMNMFNANYALDKLENLYKDMIKDKLEYGSRESFENFNIEFENVSFSYGDKKVLENLSFSLDEKKTYALVGVSGSGKSTIAKLLSGFYKTDAGNIKIGGYPLCEYTKEAIINNISFVFQNTKLFKKSIYDNVALGNENASREEVMDAIKAASCDEIIEKFKEKENTIIGSKGVYLSGGEKQRIAIARAILKKSPIVIMDEASASIDADNEYKLQKAFKNLMKDKTVIMIAHRLSSIQNVDEILVLENGKIIERGNSESLIKKQGKYSKLLNLYQSANDWRVSSGKVL